MLAIFWYHRSQSDEMIYILVFIWYIIFMHWNFSHYIWKCSWFFGTSEGWDDLCFDIHLIYIFIHWSFSHYIWKCSRFTSMQIIASLCGLALPKWISATTCVSEKLCTSTIHYRQSHIYKWRKCHQLLLFCSVRWDIHLDMNHCLSVRSVPN